MVVQTRDSRAGRPCDPSADDAQWADALVPMGVEPVKIVAPQYPAFGQLVGPDHVLHFRLGHEPGPMTGGMQLRHEIGVATHDIRPLRVVGTDILREGEPIPEDAGPNGHVRPENQFRFAPSRRLFVLSIKDAIVHSLFGNEGGRLPGHSGRTVPAKTDASGCDSGSLPQPHQPIGIGNYVVIGKNRQIAFKVESARFSARFLPATGSDRTVSGSAPA